MKETVLLLRSTNKRQRSSRRKSLDIVILPLFLLSFVFSIICEVDQASAQNDIRNSFVPESKNCSHLTLVHFLGYFSCKNVSREEELRDCDLLSYVAGELAVERVNMDPEILPLSEVKLASVSGVPTTGSEVSFVYCVYAHFLYTIDGTTSLTLKLINT